MPTALDGTTWTQPAYTRQQIVDKLTYWTEHLLEHRAGTNSVITALEIRVQLDRWLDERLALRGRCWHAERLARYCR